MTIAGAEIQETTPVQDALATVQAQLAEKLTMLELTETAKANLGEHLRRMGPTIRNALIAGALVGTAAHQLFADQGQEKEHAGNATVHLVQPILVTQPLIQEVAEPTTTTAYAPRTAIADEVTDLYSPTQVEAWADASKLAKEIAPYEIRSENAYPAIAKWVEIMDFDYEKFGNAPTQVLIGIYLQESGYINHHSSTAEGLMEVHPDTKHGIIYDANLKTAKLVEICQKLGIDTNKATGAPKTRAQLQAAILAQSETDAETQIALGVMTYKLLLDKYKNPELAALAYNRPSAANYLVKVMGGNVDATGRAFSDLVKIAQNEDPENPNTRILSYYISIPGKHKTDSKPVHNMGLTFETPDPGNPTKIIKATIYGTNYAMARNSKFPVYVDPEYDTNIPIPSTDNPGALDYANTVGVKIFIEYIPKHTNQTDPDRFRLPRKLYVD